MDDLNRFVDDHAIAELQRLLPGITLEPILKPIAGSTVPAVSVELPAPVGADYVFKLYLQPEKQIHARLLQCKGQRHYFWYRPFEDAAFVNSAEKLNAVFIETIEKLVRHETRIFQKRGLLNHSFRLEYKSSSGWQRVYGHSALRLGGFLVPMITGRQRVYHSPALLQG